MKILYFAIVAFLSLFCVEIQAQVRIHSVLRLKTPPSRSTTPFPANLFLPVHRSVANEALISEFLLQDGVEMSAKYLRQTFRNLSDTRLFQAIRLETDTTDDDELDCTFRLQERVSAAPYFMTESGGGIAAAGAGIDVVNLPLFAGDSVYCAQAKADVLYRGENSIGWEVDAEFRMRRFAESFVGGVAHFRANRLWNEQHLGLHYPLTQFYEGGLEITRRGGREIIYTAQNGVFQAMPFEEWRAALWGDVWGEYWDIPFRLSAAGNLHIANRAAPALLRSLDNTLQGIVALSTGMWSEQTVFQKFWRSESTESHVLTGVFGSVAFGVASRLGESYLPPGVAPNLGAGLINGSSFSWSVLIAGAEIPNVYAGLSFLSRLQSVGLATTASLDLCGKFNMILSTPTYSADVDATTITRETTPPLAPVILAIHARLQNWRIDRIPEAGYNFRQLVLDHETGLRGVLANAFVGDVRFVSNIEVRNIPLATVGVYQLTGTVFWDAAAVWNSAVLLNRAEATGGASSLGMGVRLQYPSLTGGRGVFRVDVAYNLVSGRFGQIVLATQEAFPLFLTEQPRLVLPRDEYEY